jgi:hypothetical protein
MEKTLNFLEIQLSSVSFHMDIRNEQKKNGLHEIQQISYHFLHSAEKQDSLNIFSARAFFPTIRDAQISEVKSLFRCWIEQKKKNKTDNKFTGRQNCF